MKRALPLLLIAVLGCSALVLPSTAKADEPEPVHRYEDDRKPPGAVRGKLFLTGALVTGGFYAPVLGASYLWPDHLAAEKLRIPVAGPWMGFSKTKLCNARPELDQCNNFLIVTGAVLLVLDGLGQAGGVGLMLESLFLQTERTRAVRGGSEKPALGSPSTSSTTYQLPKLEAPRGPLTFGRGDFRITPVPVFGADSDLGFALVGSF